MRDFAKDVALQITDIRDGVVASIRRLATLSGADAELLQFNNHERVSGKLTKVRGETFNNKHGRRSRLVICPCCIREDISSASPDMRHAAAYNRVSWTVTCMRTCVRHATPLVAIRPDVAGKGFIDFSRAIQSASHEVFDLAESAKPRTPSPFEIYIDRRLAGEATSPWLDSMPLHVALTAIESLGVALTQGINANTRSLPDGDRLEACAAGYEVLDGGIAKLQACLADLCLGFGGRVILREEPAALLGRFYYHLKFKCGADFDPIKSAVADFVFAHFAVGPEDSILDHHIGERRLHSIRSAARQHGLWVDRRLRHFLMSEALPRTTCLPGGIVMFDAPKADEVCRRLSDRLNIGQARKMLNADPWQMSALINGGYLRRYDADPRNTNPILTRSDVEVVLERIDAVSKTIDRVPDGAYTINHIARKSRHSTFSLIRLVLDGRLDWVGQISSARGIGAILLDLGEVNKLLEDERGIVTATIAAKRLCTSAESVKALVCSGVLAGDKQWVPFRRAYVVTVPTAAIEKFSSDYISIRKLALSARTNINKTKELLEDRGIHPAKGTEDAPTKFYLRKDVRQNASDKFAI